MNSFLYIAESFELKEKTFERMYEVDNADLQTFVSNGVANINKSTLVENEQKLEIFDNEEHIALQLNNIPFNGMVVSFDINITSYPIFQMGNDVLVSFFTADVEEYKQFEV